jgi:ribosome-binding protein aMBF1 (putative translation factor)
MSTVLWSEQRLQSISQERRDELRSPYMNSVKVLHSVWMNSTKEEQKDFDSTPWLCDIENMLLLIMTDGRCFDVLNPSRRTSCCCMQGELYPVLDYHERRHAVRYLFDFAKLPANGQHILVVEWMKYGSSNKYGGRAEQHMSYLFPGCSKYRVCKNAVARIIGYGQKHWTTCSTAAKNNMLPVHGHVGYESNAKLPQVYQAALLTFFQRTEQLAAPRATRYVRGFTANGNFIQKTCDDNEHLVELPTCLSKRSLYHRFLIDNGFTMTFDSKGRMVNTSAVPNVEQSFDYPPSWPTFLLYWNDNFSHVIIPKASEDICDDCYVFANAHQYRQSNPSKEVDVFHPKDKPSKKPPVTKKPKKNATEGDTTIDMSRLLMLQDEDLVIAVAKHVEDARKQRKLFNRKKKEARKDQLSDKVREERSYCFVGDFSQNMYLPNLAGEQPGAVYYFSPLNVYPFGLVDGSTEPTTLTAHLYYEGEAQKGGNAVCFGKICN